MTTIIATKTKILSDGKVSVNNRVDQLDCKKIRKIGDYLVGGAGRLSSVLTFFSWFEQNLRCQAAQESIAGLLIQSDPDKEDEEFLAIVVHPDGKIFVHEGNDPSRAVPAGTDYYAIGSGADFALAALDAGATPEEAMEVAKMRDVFSGGQTFVEEQLEVVDITDEDLLNFSKEQLLNLILTGSPDGNASDAMLEEPQESEGVSGGTFVLGPSDEKSPQK